MVERNLCLIPSMVVTSAVNLQVNCGVLSDSIDSGNPNLANNVIRASHMFLDVVHACEIDSR